MLGLPDYPFTLLEHPLGSKTLDEVKTLAQTAYTQALPILLEN